MKKTDNQIAVFNTNDIQNLIYTIRGVQVMIDRDLARLYQTETRTLKQAVKRNTHRFPDDFMFELTNNDIDDLVSQSVIPSKSYFGGAIPFAFTEQGVSMLSAVIRTPIAVEISLRIIRAFVGIRKFIINNAAIFQRLDKVEQKQIKIDEKFDKVFDALQSKELKPKQGIFFDGQVFDAYTFAADIIRTANKSIILIDNYVDDTVLKLLSKRRSEVKATIYTKNITKVLQQDLKKHNNQYPAIELKQLANSHDRFLIIDEKMLYHFGASLKDLGKKWFAFSKMGIPIEAILSNLKKVK